jgi:pimeloyl-ACP methyl ester carboxylesterase
MATQGVSHTTLAGFPAIRAEGDTARPPLLFVHGAFVDHTAFEPWMRLLARAGWRSVASARRGRLGVGPEQAAGLTIADYVEDTRRVIAALGEKPIVVGHSLGGLIAQKLAELDLVSGLTLLAPAPAGMLTAQPVALPALLPMFPNILLGRPVRPSCDACETIALNCVPKPERAAMHARLVHESGRVYREMIFGTFKVDRAKVRCPVLVIGGSEDRIVSPALARSTATRYAADLKFFEGHGHWLLEEPGWEVIAGAVGTWLETKFPATHPLAGAA